MSWLLIMLMTMMLLLIIMIFIYFLIYPLLHTFIFNKNNYFKPTLWTWKW